MKKLDKEQLKNVTGGKVQSTTCTENPFNSMLNDCMTIYENGWMCTGTYNWLGGGKTECGWMNDADRTAVKASAQANNS